MRLSISQDNFFDLQSVYMSDPKFCEALTKLDMETLPIEEKFTEEAKIEQSNNKRDSSPQKLMPSRKL